ncbi:replication protein A 70 kDa DNA-binding subunit-like isoform X2 [Babylonia areolata]|uniref:replication protein A 70 kDa DNA-binding subunit-like isoform X2 n=1 Tax=Babylonia areolata TaxID=304850 RepID=UPI003FCFFA49
MATLSGGSIDVMVKGGPQTLQPVLQVINLKKIASNGSNDRYRLLVSDGETTYSHVMLATQLNVMMEANEIDAFCVIKVNKYLCNTIQADKRILILLDITVLKKGSEVKERLGNPSQYKADGTGATNGTAHGDSAPPAKAPAPTLANPARPLGGIKTSPPKQGPNSFGGNKPPSGPGTPGSNRVHKIATLTPYQNRWRIRARVTQKSSIRTWSNSRGEGRLFSVNFLDDSDEIRATGFNDAVDKFYDLLEVNKVYYVSRCSIKTANKQYSNLKNDYEMTFNNDTIIERCDDDVDLPSMTFDFVPISEMEKHAANSIVDVVGVVKLCNDLSTVIARQSQKELTKRDLQIVDQSGVAISITLWGNDAQNFDGSSNPVIAVKGARLSDFGGRSLSVLSSSQLVINPDIREAHVLRGWYDREGASMDFGSFRSEGGGAGGSTNWKTFGQAVSENLGHGDKADYYTTKATIMVMKKENCMYQACSTENCNKKVVDQGNGLYRCEKCNRESPSYKWRMILQTTMADFSGYQWVSCFQDSAETLLGVKADELGDMRQNDEGAFDQVFQRGMFKEYTFRLRSKMETYNEESRLKTVCVAATPVDYVQYGKHLLEEIRKFGL